MTYFVGSDGSNQSRVADWVVKLGILDYCRIDISNQDKFSIVNINWDRIRTFKSQSGQKIIALGIHAHTALQKENILHYYLPHPSGKSSKFNDPDFIRFKLAECRAWLNGQIALPGEPTSAKLY